VFDCSERVRQWRCGELRRWQLDRGVKGLRRVRAGVRLTAVSGW
jgi:hypothetical protein